MSGDALTRMLQADELAPVCLLGSSEPLLLLEAADAVRARSRELGYAERVVMDVDARFDWSELAAASVSMSLFSSRRLLELRLPTGRPGREGGEAIRNFCQSPPPDTVLLIVAGDWSKQHEGAWSQAVAKVGLVHAIPALNVNQLPAWIAQRLRRHGLKAEPDALMVLAERVEGNLLAAAQEVDKLALLLPADASQPSAAISAQQMLDLVADSARFDAFGLTDAALAGDAARSLRVLRGLRAEGSQVPALLGPINYAVSLLAGMAEAEISGGSSERFLQQARIWEAKKAVYRAALKRGSPKHWLRVLAELGRIDRMSKGRLDGDAWLALERLLVRVAKPRAGLSA